MNILIINHNSILEKIVKRLIINNNIYIFNSLKNNDYIDYSNVKYINNNELKRLKIDYILFNINDNLITNIYNIKEFFISLDKNINIIKKVKSCKHVILFLYKHVKYKNIYENFYKDLFKILNNNSCHYSIIEYNILTIDVLFNIENFINYQEKNKYKKMF